MLDIIIGGIISHPWKDRIDNIFHLSDCVSFLMSDVFFIYRVNCFTHMTQGNSAVIGGNGIGFQ